MTFDGLREFFMWCTIINGGLLIFSFLMLAFARKLIYKIHGCWFPMSQETFTVTIYGLLGIYKILVFLFNVVPWIALLIMDSPSTPM
jgi:hypothetical protein